MGTSKILSGAVALVVAGMVGSSARAADGTWNVNADGTWSNSANWLNNIIADGTDATANFTFDLTANHTVTNDTARTIGNLVFNDTGAASDSAWTLTGATANPLTFSTTSGTSNITANSTIGYSAEATISAVLAGSNNLNFIIAPSATTTQPQIVVNNAGNTYTGTTTISNGFLNVGANSLLVSTNGALGNSNSAIVVGSSATSTTAGVNTGAPSVGLDVTSSATNGPTYTIARNIDSSTTADVAGRTDVRYNSNTATANGTLTVTGNWALGTNGTHSYGLVAQQAAQTLNFTGNITGTGATAALRLNDYGNGNGTIRLAGANTYAGPTLVESGALVIGGNAPATGGVLGNNTSTTALQLASSGTTALNSGSSAASISATTDGGYTVAKAVGLNNSNVTTGGVSNLPQAYSWTLGGSSANASAFSGNVNSPNTAFSRTLNLTQAASGTTIFSGVINANADATNVTTVEKTGAGTVVLTGTNTYDGGTRITNGTLLVNGTGVAGTSSGAGTGAVTVGVVSNPLTGASGSILNSGTGALTTRQINNISLAVAQGLQVGQTVTGTGIPASSVVQSVAYNASGTASVVISNAISAPATTGISFTDLAFGALTTTGTLGGSGSVNGPITVNAGSTFAPGASGGTSTANFTDTAATGTALTLAAGSFTTFDVNGPTPGTDYDSFTTSTVSTGALAYGGTFTINLPTVTSGVYNLFNTALKSGDFSSVILTGPDAGLLSLTNVAPGTGTGVWNGTFGTDTVAFSEATGILTVVTTVTTAAPEPASLAVLGLTGVALVKRRRRVCVA